MALNAVCSCCSVITKWTKDLKEIMVERTMAVVFIQALSCKLDHNPNYYSGLSTRLGSCYPITLYGLTCKHWGCLKLSRNGTPNFEGSLCTPSLCATTALFVFDLAVFDPCESIAGLWSLSLCKSAVQLSER